MSVLAAALRAPRRFSTPARDALVLPAIRTSVLFIMSVMSVTADRVRYEHASCCRDGDGADEQKDGCEASKCAELHNCHLLSHHLVPRKRRWCTWPSWILVEVC